MFSWLLSQPRDNKNKGKASSTWLLLPFAFHHKRDTKYLSSARDITGLQRLENNEVSERSANRFIEALERGRTNLGLIHEQEI